MKLFYLFFISYLSTLNSLPIKFNGSSSSIVVNGSSNFNVATILTASGNIKKSASATITGSNTGSRISFTDGLLDLNSPINSSSYNFTTTPAQSLDGSKTFKAIEGSSIDNLTVSGTSNILTGSPTFNGTVTLTSGSDISFGIKSKMNVDVALGSGTVKLSDDLRFSDNKRFTGTGTVDLQNYKLKFGAKPLAFTSAITWFNASDIDLGGLTTLSTTWTLTGDAVINGNGNVLDMTAGGVIAINAGTTVSIADAYIKGLGSTGDITFADNTTSILRLSNVFIEMSGSKTISGGQVFIDGPTTIITKNNTLTFSSNGVLTINGQSLQYDRLGNVSGGITPTTAGANLVLNNGARVIEINSPADLSSLNTQISTINNKLATIDVGPGNISISGSGTMSYDWFVSEDHAISVSATSTLSGNGHKIKFSDHTATQLTVANSVTLTTSDMILEDLQPSQVSLGSGSAIIFGNNSTVRLGKNSTLNSTWRFSGACMLDGQNKMLTLGSSGVIEAQASSTLTLKDLTIYDINGTNLRCLDNTGSIIFDNVKLINRNRWRFQNGAFSVLNNLSFLGGGIYSYESAYASTINDNSNLIFSDAITFSYDPAKGAEQAVAGQQNLIFTNTSSKLICDGITLKITNTGMRLTTGTIQFDRSNNLYIDAKITDTSHALIFGNGIIENDAQIIAGPGAQININSGIMRYENIEYNYLRYGDGVVLRHKNYGFYISNSNFGAGGAYGTSGIGNPTLTDSGRFYVQPGNIATRWGTGIAGTYVTSGAPTRFESFQASVSGTFFGINIVEPAAVSSPNPPYCRVNFNYGTQGYIAYTQRLYKKGGAFGDKIKLGDEVYIQNGSQATNPYYVGSSNNAAYGAFEVFYYQVPNTLGTPPANFETQFIWVVDTIIKDAHLQSPNNDAVGVYASTGWAANPATLYQF